MQASPAYPKTAYNTVHRRAARAAYDVATINTIINETSVLHVSFVPDEAPQFPTILPMIGQMGSFSHPSAGTNEPLDCYLHGYVSSRLMNQSSRSADQGLPVAIAATKVDGLVLGLTPFSHSYNYRSAVIFGHAMPVTDNDEKLFAMRLITDSVVPHRWENTRVPPDGAEMASTQILRVRVVSASAKVHTGHANDEKKDLSRDDVTGSVWTGVIPVEEHYLSPVPSTSNRIQRVPDYISSFVEQTNERNKLQSLKSADGNAQ